MTRELHNESMRRHNDRLAQLEVIYIACLKANQNSRERLEIGLRAVRLTDVLLALADARVGMIADASYQKPGYINIFPAPDSPRRFMQEPTWCRWNGLQDDLTQQSDECVAFLARLLGFADQNQRPRP